MVRVASSADPMARLRFLVARLMEMHGESYGGVTVDDKGQQVQRPDGYEPPVQTAV